MSKDENQLREASDAAAEELLSRVSYDLRTPLSGITSMVSLLLDSELDPEQREMAEVISDSASALLAVLETTVEQMQVRASNEVVESEFDLRTMIEELSNFLAVKAQDKDLAYTCLVQHDVPAFVRADVARLRQILIELIGNAIKFTTSGEVVVNVATEGDEDGVVWVRFSVNDTGKGLSLREQEKLSQMFATPSDQGGGGLHFARKLTADIGGRIGVASEPGNGSTFFLSVPLHKLPITDTGAIRLAQSLHDKKILVVDRSKAVRRLICNTVTHWGCLPSEATTAEQALELLRGAAAKGTPFAVALVDSEIGSLTAEELCVAARMDDILDETAMILLTPLARKAQAGRIQKVGFRSHLTKPVRQRLLHDVLVTTLYGVEKTPRPPRTSIVTDHFLSQLSSTGTRVLVVDDHMVSRKVAQRLLTRMGCRTTVVDSGEAALSAMTRESFDLVLMDLQMPGMDGLETTQRIRRKEAPGAWRLPIVAMTAHALDKDRYACLEAGMDDFLAKPIDIEQLGAIVKRWTERGRSELSLAFDSTRSDL